jgi:hypothetical protein
VHLASPFDCARAHYQTSEVLSDRIGPFDDVDDSNERFWRYYLLPPTLIYTAGAGCAMRHLTDAIWRLLPRLSELPSDERWRRLLLVMQAYVDDSIEPPVFVLAGFVARAEQWAELTARWRETRDKPPRLEYFKMKEAHALQGQFRGWSKADRNTRLAEFVDIIREHVLVAVYSVVHQRDYHNVMKKRLAAQLDNPYWLMYHSIMMTVGRWEEGLGLHEPVDFIFDEQGRQSEQVESIHSILIEHAPSGIRALFGARPDHRDDKETLPLQSADLLAWHVRRAQEEKDKGHDFDTPTMRSLRAIPHVEDLWTRERLVGFLGRTRALTRELGRVMPHEVTGLQKIGPNVASRHNLGLIGTAASRSTLLLMPFPAIGIKRFLLVHSCPLSGSPHLHRRAGNRCLAEKRDDD